MKKHFVTFYAPGTFMPESSTREIDSWSIEDAVKMAGTETMRYGARPYAFRFFTMGRGAEDLDSKEVASSGNYYLGGKLETLDDVEARNDPKEATLRRNMKNNDIKQIIVNDNSWRFTGPFKDGDTLLDVTLPALQKGNA